MATSLKTLQEQVDLIYKSCPVLAPIIAPHGCDIDAICQRSKDSSEIESMLEAAAERAKCCCICGGEGQASTSDGPEDEDPATFLMFTALARLNYQEKKFCITSGGFACGKCRALCSASRMLQFAALRVSQDYPDRQTLLLELCSHLAALNNAPESIASNSDALLVWTQEIMSHAYTHQVLCRAIPGWQVVGPDGKKIDPKVSGSVAGAIQALLSPPAAKTKPTGKKRKQSISEPDTPAVSPNIGTGVNLHEKTPASSMKKKKKSISQAGTPAPSPGMEDGVNTTEKTPAGIPSIKKKKRVPEVNTPATSPGMGNGVNLDEKTPASSAKKKTKLSETGTPQMTPGTAAGVKAGVNLGEKTPASSAKKRKSISEACAQEVTPGKTASVKPGVKLTEKTPVSSMKKKLQVQATPAKSTGGINGVNSAVKTPSSSVKKKKKAMAEQ